MKREYRVADELEKQRSLGQFRVLAADGAIMQFVLPLAGGKCAWSRTAAGSCCVS
jgi:hypothetical protein